MESRQHAQYDPQHFGLDHSADDDDLNQRSQEFKAGFQAKLHENIQMIKDKNFPDRFKNRKN